MSAPGALTSLETAIRKALAADAFAEAQSLTGRYVAEVERLLRALPPGAEEVAAMQERTRSLFTFANALATASRSYAGAQLDHLRLLARYRETRVAPAILPASQSTA